MITIAGIIAILLLSIFMIFLYCACKINRGEYNEERKFNKSKDTTNVDTNK